MDLVKEAIRFNGKAIESLGQGNLEEARDHLTTGLRLVQTLIQPGSEGSHISHGTQQAFMYHICSVSASKNASNTSSGGDTEHSVEPASLPSFGSLMARDKSSDCLYFDDAFEVYLIQDFGHSMIGLIPIDDQWHASPLASAMLFNLGLTLHRMGRKHDSHADLKYGLLLYEKSFMALHNIIPRSTTSTTVLYLALHTNMAHVHGQLFNAVQSAKLYGHVDSLLVSNEANCLTPGEHLAFHLIMWYSKIQSHLPAPCA